ncbi:hypothetical protein [Alkaliphilus serpentinus]|uniref:Uncharacterized protein n=1 Tax=Alkaliphilus serpentinus TaxID=1482731 RepID=A0A833HQE1_9FIRM|nr:hypothetical protein [Alkaliphilus serpentinus]KAB3531804.1 hypothetical protein F8153_03545 [Alkaliphilus serpentinus]
MAALIRHTACEPQKPLWQTLLSIVGIVLGINFLVQMIHLLPAKLAALASIAVLLFSARVCSYLINRKLAKYSYLLIDNQLIIQKQLGKRENAILDIKISDIQWIGPLREFKKEKKYKKTYYLACRTRGDKVYVCEFTKNYKSYALIFQPNEAIAKELKGQLGNKQ